MADKIIVIAGPTASGKTRLGIELAKACGGEIVSADSMQVYRRMDIGTAKADESERAQAVHHMLDVAEPWENYSVARYVEDAAPDYILILLFQAEILPTIRRIWPCAVSWRKILTDSVRRPC